MEPHHPKDRRDGQTTQRFWSWTGDAWHVPLWKHLKRPLQGTTGIRTAVGAGCASYPELIIMLKRPSQTLPGSSLLWLRCYPLRFGMAIRDLLHKLMTRGRGKPEDVPGYCGASDAGSTNINLPGEDWEDADLRPVIKYLRGCTFLQLPPLWKEAFPKAI